MTKKKQRLILAATIVFFWASEYCHTPYFTPYLNTLGFSAQAIGFIVGVYGMTQMMIRIPLGIATDATSGYKGAIIMGTFFTTLSSFLLVFARSEIFIVICRALAGIAASTWLAFSVLYNSYFTEEDGVTAMTNVNAFSNGGKMLAFLLGLVASTYGGFILPLWCSVWTGAIAFVLSFFVVATPIRREPFRFSHVARIATTPIILVASFLGIVLQAVCQGTVFSFTSTLARGLGASNFLIGLCSTVFTVIQIIAAPFLGKKLKSIPRTVSVTLSMSAFALSLVIAGLAPNVYVIFIANAIAGIGNLIGTSMFMNMVVTAVTEEHRATAMGFYQAIYGIGMTAGPNLIGRITQAFSISTAYLAMAAFVALVALASPVMIKAASTRKAA